MAETWEQPLVSVIMPVRNEEKRIAQSVGAVLCQDYPRDRLEVLVADGMSEDATRAILNELSQMDQRVRVIENRARIMAAGFNTALALARGEVIVMLGGHTEVAPDYVNRCVRELLEGRADCVGGPLETVCETAKAAAIALTMSSPFGVGGATFRTGTKEKRYVDTLAFGAYTRRIMEQVGSLDEELVRNQDDEYNYRLRKMGGKPLLVPGIRCRYYSRSSLRTLWRQYFQYGYWKVRVMQKHPGQMQVRHFVPGAFVTALAVTGISATVFPVGRLLLTLVLAAYIFANLAASVWTARRGSWQQLSLLPLAFAILHLSYGFGFVKGILDFVVLGRRGGRVRPQDLHGVTTNHGP